MSNTTRIVLGLFLVGATAGSAAAASPTSRSFHDTLRIQMYNGSTVARSDCRVMGKNTSNGSTKFIASIVHKGASSTRTYTTHVPSQYDEVIVACRANGPRVADTVERARHPFHKYYYKSTCASSQSDGVCTLYMYSGNPM